MDSQQNYMSFTSRNDDHQPHPQYHRGHEDRSSGGFFNWVGAFFKYFFIFILILIAIGALASIPGFIIFSLYVSAAITIPWLTSFLVGAGLAHSLALFISLMMVPLVAIAIGLAFYFIIDSTCRYFGKENFSKYSQKGRDQTMELIQSYQLAAWLLGFIIIFAPLTGIGVGIYLSVLIIPAAITSIMAMGVSAPLATFAGIFLAFGLVGMAVFFFNIPATLTGILFELPNMKEIRKNPMELLGPLGLLGGLGLGAYSAAMFYPVLVAALPIAHAPAVLASLILAVGLVFTVLILIQKGTTGLALLFSPKSGDTGYQFSENRERPMTKDQLREQHQTQFSSSARTLDSNEDQSHQASSRIPTLTHGGNESDGN